MGLSPYQTLSHFIITTLQQRRSQPAGLQFADDPELVRGVIQSAMKIFGNDHNLTLTRQQIDNIFTMLHAEAAEYEKQYKKYLDMGDYKIPLEDCKMMLERLIAKPPAGQ